MSKPTIDVVVAGHICLDIIPSFLGKAGEVEIADLFRPGCLVNMGGLTMSSGGPVSNTGIGLTLLGANVELMGKYGTDPLSQNLKEILAKRGLDSAMVQVEGEQTSYTVVLAPPGIDRIFLHCPGANSTYTAEDLNLDVISKAKIFHLGYPPLMKSLYDNDGEQLAEIYKRVKENCPNVITSMDMSLPDPSSESGKVNWAKVLEKTLPYVDFYLPSAEETLFMLEPEAFLKLRDSARGSGTELLDLIPADKIMELSDKILGYGVAVNNIKSGHRGIYTHTAGKERMEQIKWFATPEQRDNWTNRELWHAAFLVDPIGSATGSGDSSISGYINSFLRGCPIEEALKMSNAVGGCNVTQLDALSGIKTWDETAKLVKDGWVNRDPQIGDDRFTNIIEKKLWAGPRDKK